MDLATSVDNILAGLTCHVLQVSRVFQSNFVPNIDMKLKLDLLKSQLWVPL